MAERDPIVQDVMDLMAAREAKGRIKYGTTTFDNPLSLKQWLQHALEETLDKAVYLRRAIVEIERDPGFSIVDHHHKAMSRILNERCRIEEVLMDFATGKRPMPDAETMRLLSIALGTPKDRWSDRIKAAVKGEVQGG